MGKSPEAKRLLFWVTPDWEDRPEMIELRDKGHMVLVMGMDDLRHHQPDVILSPAAHYWDDTMWEGNLLDVAIKAARQRKGGKKNASS